MKLELRYALKSFIAVFGILAAVALSAGCGSSDANQQPESQLARPVKAVKLSLAPPVRQLRLPGAAKAERDTNLSFRVGGPLVSLKVDTGSIVKEGQVIAEIDLRDFQIRVNTSRAKLNSSRAQLDEAKLQYERYAKLIKTKAVAQAEYDRIKAAYEVALAQEQSDSKALEDAKNAMADTVLKAPFSGVIDERFVDNHEKVQAGQPIVSLVDLGSMEVRLALSENLLPLAGHFDSYTCVFDALPGRKFNAVLKEVGQKADQASRTYPLILTLGEDARSVVRPGMSAEVTVSLKNSGETTGFVVPLTALTNQTGQKAFVWLVDEKSGGLSKVPVQIMGLRDQGAEVSGQLAAGQWIVTAGVSHLRTDLKVRLLDEPSKTNVGLEM